MSNTSNNHGRAYEFICLNALYDAISKVRPTKIIKNSSYTVAEKAWNVLSQIEKDLYTLSATSTIDTIFALEPNIVEKSNDILNLYISKMTSMEKKQMYVILLFNVKILFGKLG